MSISLDQKLALERCQLYMAQLCAITHFMDDELDQNSDQRMTHIQALIRKTVNELRFLEGRCC